MRATPSVVVLPLTPALTTRQCNPAWSKSFCKKSGKLLPGSAPNPAVKLSPNATITGCVSKFDGSFGAAGVAFSAGADSDCVFCGAGRDPAHPTSIRPNTKHKHRIKVMILTQCHNKKLEV